MARGPARPPVQAGRASAAKAFRVAMILVVVVVIVVVCSVFRPGGTMDRVRALRAKEWIAHDHPSEKQIVDRLGKPSFTMDHGDSMSAMFGILDTSFSAKETHYFHGQLRIEYGATGQPIHVWFPLKLYGSQANGFDLTR
jgi:hypothetical protein